MVEPVAKSFGSKGWDLALLRNVQHRLHQVAESRSLTEEVCDFGRNGGQFRPAIDVSKGVCVQWTLMFFIIVRHEFGLISRHVHVNWAFAFASFAAQTQIEGFFYSFVLPAFF